MAEHPFRSQDISPLCTTCREQTELRCAVCNRPYCKEHLDFGWRCRRCAPKVASGYRTVFLTGLVVLILFSVLSFVLVLRAMSS